MDDNDHLVWEVWRGNEPVARCIDADTAAYLMTWTGIGGSIQMGGRTFWEEGADGRTEVDTIRDTVDHIIGLFGDQTYRAGKHLKEVPLDEGNPSGLC